MELFGLVSFIDEYVFADAGSYKAQFSRLSGNNAENYEDLKQRLSKVCQRTLRKQVAEYVKYTNRIPLTQEYTPSEKERQLYGKMMGYLSRKEIYAFSPQNRALMTLILMRLLGSSSFAIAGTIKSLMKKLIVIIKSGKIERKVSDIDVDPDLVEELEDELEDSDEQVIVKTLSPEEIEKAKEELNFLGEVYELASSIEENAKGAELVSALEKGFETLRSLGAPEKALIFTEFRRTQEYLVKILSKTKYKDKIVTFNGTNDDDLSKKIYLNWLNKNLNTDRLNELASNPSEFIRQISLVINNELVRLLVMGIKYEKIAGDSYEMRLFERDDLQEYFVSKAVECKNHLFDVVEYDSETERRFAIALSQREDIELFVKLPKWFSVDTPLGRYNPDWAIVKKGEKKLYLVRETKGSTNYLQLRSIEDGKIKCGKEHFKTLDVDFQVVTRPDEIA